MAFQQTFPAADGWIWGVSDFGAAQTDTELIAAPGAGKQIEILAWKFSSDIAQTLTLEQGTATLLDKQYVAANGGQIARMGYPIPHSVPAIAGVKLADNTSLTFTSSGAGNVSVGVLYRIVSR
ncbi:MAG: hypothetical protein ACE5F5_12450 [Acidimicrobiia bacterium]